MWKNVVLASFLGSAVVVAAACEGPEGPPGPAGAPAPGEAGPPGPQGSAGPPSPLTDASFPRAHSDTGPGLKLAVSRTTIDASGVVTVAFTVTDGAGAPLDVTGKYTDGAIVPKLVLSWLREDASGNPLDYAAYTTQDKKSVDGTKHAALPDADVGGTLAEVGAGDGTYTYTFATKLPATFDKTKTHTLGIWAYRDFGGKRYVVNTLHHFVPSGSAVKSKRDIVNTQACNQCHNPLKHHEDDNLRREVGLCILCHSSSTVDVSNGNSMAMPEMIHKLHRGKNLPSVIGGTPYVLTTDDATFNDHSDTWFPGGDVQNCAMCHKGSQGDVWKKKAPTRSTCTACHDRTSFTTPPPAGFTLHPAGVQMDDTACATCHTESGIALVSIVDAHATAFTDPNATKLVLAIASVARTAPGQTPVLHFTVTKDGQPLDLLATPLNALAVTFAGPTTDYAASQPTQYAIQGARPTPGGVLALDGAVGSYTYAFPSPVAPSATGTWAVGMEGYVQPDVKALRYAALNPVAYVAVTDPTPVPRRQIVERDKCNSCHDDLNAHGGMRKSPEYCVLCHTPGKVNDQRVARFEVPTTAAPSVNFKVLVHKIHRGNKLDQGYVLGSYPPPTPTNPGGTPVDFGTVGFPGDLRACWSCHAGTTYRLPLSPGQLPTKTMQVLACNDRPLNPLNYCTSRTVQSESFLQPIGAACTGCHDKPATVAHVQIMTATDGTESCETCHGNGAQWDVQRVHTLDP